MGGPVLRNVHRASFQFREFLSSRSESHPYYPPGYARFRGGEELERCDFYIEHGDFRLCLRDFHLCLGIEKATIERGLALSIPGTTRVIYSMVALILHS